MTRLHEVCDMLEYICPQCGTFSLESSACSSCDLPIEQTPRESVVR